MTSVSLTTESRLYIIFLNQLNDNLDHEVSNSQHSQMAESQILGVLKLK